MLEETSEVPGITVILCCGSVVILTLEIEKVKFLSWRISILPGVVVCCCCYNLQ